MLLPFFDGIQDFSGVGTIVLTDNAVFSHPVNHPRRSTVADTQTPLKQRTTASALSHNDVNGIIVKGIVGSWTAVSGTSAFCLPAASDNLLQFLIEFRFNKTS